MSQSKPTTANNDRLSRWVPIPAKDLEALEDYLSESDPKEFDGTLKRTIDFLRKHNLMTQKVKEWLQGDGRRFNDYTLWVNLVFAFAMA